MPFIKLATSVAAIAAVSATAAAARDQVQVAGSSTVLPYASIVAEAFGENFDFPTPVVESGGSSAGLKRFCGRGGREHHRHRQCQPPDQGLRGQEMRRERRHRHHRGSHRL